MTKFHGVLAVFDKPANNGQTLAAPGDGFGWQPDDPDGPGPLPVIVGEIAPAQLLLPGVHMPDATATIVGFIESVVVDGDLLRCGGTLELTDRPTLAAEIRAGKVVGQAIFELFDYDPPTGEVISKYALIRVALVRADEKLWPEVSLTIGSTPDPLAAPIRDPRVQNAGGSAVLGDRFRVDRSVFGSGETWRS